jgi:hypothetical protein
MADVVEQVGAHTEPAEPYYHRVAMGSVGIEGR